MVKKLYSVLFLLLSMFVFQTAFCETEIQPNENVLAFDSIDNTITDTTNAETGVLAFTAGGEQINIFERALIDSLKNTEGIRRSTDWMQVVGWPEVPDRAWIVFGTDVGKVCYLVTT